MSCGITDPICGPCEHSRFAKKMKNHPATSFTAAYQSKLAMCDFHKTSCFEAHKKCSKHKKQP